MEPFEMWLFPLAPMIVGGSVQALNASSGSPDVRQPAFGLLCEQPGQAVAGGGE